MSVIKEFPLDSTWSIDHRNRYQCVNAKVSRSVHSAYIDEAEQCQSFVFLLMDEAQLEKVFHPSKE